MHPEPPGTPHHHEFIFDPAYVLAYGPFEAHDHENPNDPNSQPIDYCVYLYPTNGYLDSQVHFVYGGSDIHPIQIEKFPEYMPVLTLIKELDSLSIQFLALISDLFRRGTFPATKVQIPCHLMQWPLWIEPNIFEQVIHYSPIIEMLLQVATYYVKHSMRPYSQLL